MSEMRTADEVDTIVAAWKRAQPDFDPEPLQIFSRLWRLQSHIDKMRRQTFARHGIESWEFDMLCALRREPTHRLTAGRLTRETLVSSGTVTNRINRMESHGYARRLCDPQDGRLVLVEATEEGIAVVDAAMSHLLAVEEAHMVGMDSRERRELADLLRTLLGHFN